MTDITKLLKKASSCVPPDLRGEHSVWDSHVATIVEYVRKLEKDRDELETTVQYMVHPDTVEDLEARCLDAEAKLEAAREKLEEFKFHSSPREMRRCIDDLLAIFADDGPVEWKLDPRTAVTCIYGFVGWITGWPGSTPAGQNEWATPWAEAAADFLLSQGVTIFEKFYSEDLKPCPEPPKVVLDAFVDDRPATQTAQARELCGDPPCDGDEARPCEGCPVEPPSFDSHDWRPSGDVMICASCAIESSELLANYSCLKTDVSELGFLSLKELEASEERGMQMALEAVRNEQDRIGNEVWCSFTNDPHYDPAHQSACQLTRAKLFEATQLTPARIRELATKQEPSND